MVNNNHEVVQGILERFMRKSKLSQKHDVDAKRCLPGGDTRTATYYNPYPIYMEKGHGCYIYDCDTNEYIDMLNNYTSLIHGHTHPGTLEACHTQLDKGVIFGSPAEIQFLHADHLCSRIPSMDMVRYCNSGTEATLFASRAARVITGKDIIIKMDGGYHGSHDLAEVNIFPDIKSDGLPVAYVQPGVPISTLKDVLVCPFNDIDAMESILKKNNDKVAAVILEPMLGAAGQIPSQPGYLKDLRELTERYGVLLIFDEVMTFRLGVGGLQGAENISPDLTTIGKFIGGGLPVGAFGGRREIMTRFDPNHKESIFHSGTFNGNNITMCAGLATLEAYDQTAVDRLNALGDRLRHGLNEAFKKTAIKGKVTGIGSLMQVHWGDSRLLNARDSVLAKNAAGALPGLLHLEMMNQGINTASRGMIIPSTPMTEQVIDNTISAFEDTLDFLRPYIFDKFPNMLVNI